MQIASKVIVLGLTWESNPCQLNLAKVQKRGHFEGTQGLSQALKLPLPPSLGLQVSSEASGMSMSQE